MTGGALSRIFLRDLRKTATAPRGGGIDDGRKDMAILTRRSVLRASLGAAATGTLARPYIANAAATTASMWVVQGFVPEEDAAYKEMVADYQKASGNTIDYSIIPFAPMRQKMVSAVSSGVVPDCMETADFYVSLFEHLGRQARSMSAMSSKRRRQRWSKNAHDCSFAYNSTAQRSAAIIRYRGNRRRCRFMSGNRLVEKSGHKVADIPKTWDAFNTFFRPVQDDLRKQGMRNIYAMGYS